MKDGLQGEYPDGQFRADLRGFSMDAAVPPASVLRRFLAEVGISPAAGQPGSLAGLNQLWQSITTERHISVFLDDALSAAQVRCLLPGPGPALVVVTTRWRLSWMPWDDAQIIET